MDSLFDLVHRTSNIEHFSEGLIVLLMKMDRPRRQTAASVCPGWYRDMDSDQSGETDNSEEEVVPTSPIESDSTSSQSSGKPVHFSLWLFCSKKQNHIFFVDDDDMWELFAQI